MEGTSTGESQTPQKKDNITINKIANGFIISFGYGSFNVNYFPTIEDAMNRAKEYFG
ncbi:hypothetical protein [uncultured Desulfobulbus sp.]|uniref:hypothetical protein n=1 Tax=uncultured Desulfobulbus sp. TaxID=239745 RepID=UPI0029C90381|nr:hypothetical protein [uncultured Desulfobulbus sp.]